MDGKPKEVAPFLDEISEDVQPKKRKLELDEVVDENIRYANLLQPTSPLKMASRTCRE